MNLTTILLQMDGSMIQSIVMMVLIIGVFYFFMIRPQAKKQKEINNFRAALKAGDQVVTAGGIYGVIKSMDETTVKLEIADNVRIKVEKNSIFATAENIQK
ncbi:MAG: preprotein translocase subunit YajC [Bacteroidales bacterium]